MKNPKVCQLEFHYLLTNIELTFNINIHPDLGFPRIPHQLDPGRSHTTSTNMGTKRWTTSCDAALDLVLVKTVSKKITASMGCQKMENEDDGS